MNLEFTANVAAMRHHGFDRYIQQLGNFFVRHAFHHANDNFFLPVAQRIIRAILPDLLLCLGIFLAGLFLAFVFQPHLGFQ